MYNYHTNNAIPVYDYELQVNHAMINQVAADVYVSPDGDNTNSGLTPEEPLKNIWYAMTRIQPDTNNQRTIHVLPGTYSPSINDEIFPINARSNSALIGVDKNTCVLDAEETWIHAAVDALTTAAMQKYNTEKALVFNTAQLYRHDRLQFLKDSNAFAVQNNFKLGMKLVRGAYMEKERERAAEMNYKSPINDTKQATDDEYNAAVEFCVNPVNNVSVVIGSHNEYSNLYATQLLEKFSVPFNSNDVHFSQLYGMSDNITFNLAKAGCNVSKYLPFGPINDVIPYLMRRAQENSSVSGQTGRELLLINKEMKRRKNG